MQLKLYDSYHRAVRPFTPLAPGAVRMYACGPTVYDYAHIGNLRTYLFEDTLRRALEFFGYEVRHVINITDVGHLTSDADSGEDKMRVGARREGLSAWEIAERYTRAFQKDFADLNMLPPEVWCRATDHIAEQIDDIVEIERRGYTYATADGIYFDTAKLKTYGRLARLDLAGQDPGARVAVGDKRNPSDFALWKLSRPDENRQMEWDSPWGRGFPGWHIECSAMAVKYLGKKFDIHCGGKDHIPVHHVNEIAQSEARHGSRLANFWMHGYFLETAQAKMSKSAGEFLRLAKLRELGYEPLVFRYLCLTAHYRSDLNFTWESLDAARAAMQRLRELAHSWSADDMNDGGDDGDGEIDSAAAEKFSRALCRDLNTSDALAAMWALAKGELSAPAKLATLRHFDRALGLNILDWRPRVAEIPDEVTELARRRDAARTNRDFDEADALRAKIYELGFEIEDAAGGSKLSPRKS